MDCTPRQLDMAQGDPVASRVLERSPHRKLVGRVSARLLFEQKLVRGSVFSCGVVPDILFARLVRGNWERRRHAAIPPVGVFTHVLRSSILL